MDVHVLDVDVVVVGGNCHDDDLDVVVRHCIVRRRGPDKSIHRQPIFEQSILEYMKTLIIYMLVVPSKFLPHHHHHHVQVDQVGRLWDDDDALEVLRRDVVRQLRAQSDHYALQDHDPDSMDQLERQPSLDLGTFGRRRIVVAVVVVVAALEDGIRRGSFSAQATASVDDRKHSPDYPSRHLAE